jgi:hypothetical protein
MLARRADPVYRPGDGRVRRSARLRLVAFRQRVVPRRRDLSRSGSVALDAKHQAAGPIPYLRRVARVRGATAGRRPLSAPHEHSESHAQNPKGGPGRAEGLASWLAWTASYCPCASAFSGFPDWTTWYVNVSGLSWTEALVHRVSEPARNSRSRRHREVGKNVRRVTNPSVREPKTECDHCQTRFSWSAPRKACCPARRMPVRRLDARRAERAIVLATTRSPIDPVELAVDALQPRRASCRSAIGSMPFMLKLPRRLSSTPPIDRSARCRVLPVGPIGRDKINGFWES